MHLVPEGLVGTGTASALAPAWAQAPERSMAARPQAAPLPCTRTSAAPPTCACMRPTLASQSWPPRQEEGVARWRPARPARRAAALQPASAVRRGGGEGVGGRRSAACGALLPLLGALWP